MKIIKLKKVTGLVIALLMAITFMAQPLVVLADTYGEPENGYSQPEAADYLADDESEYPQEEVDPVIAVRIEFFEALYRAIPEVTRFAYLTEEAREIALYDFDYFAETMLATAPTRHMFGRLFGVTLENYLDGLRQLIYEMVPVPSLTALSMGGDRWVEEPTDDLMIAADYMFTLLLLFVFETGGFGHFIVQELPIVEQMFFVSSFILQSDESVMEATLLEYEAMGLDPERSLDAMLRFHQVHYATYNLPSVIWFYGLDSSEFDFSAGLADVGFMDVENVTTAIIEPGQIAYFNVASFMNNMIMDAEVLFNFYYEIQDYEHLIIDIRGNGGGFAGYFPALILSMLIGENMSFMYPEFFVANEKTAPLFENPMSLAMADLYGIFPAAEYVRSQNMTQFNQNDLALLDYVAVWSVEYIPSDYAIPFGGQIWLLVDEDSASASVMAAMISANTGFATVVGTPTSRVTGVVYTHVALPNTGVLFRIDLGYTTDQYGRSIEEFGVIPQVANFAGMDALETVLAIINEADPQAQDIDVYEEDNPVRNINGTYFVRLRYVAASLGADVEWDGPNQSVIVTMADGSSFVVVVSTYGVINYNGRVYVPVDNVAYVFADLVA